MNFLIIGAILIGILCPASYVFKNTGFFLSFSIELDVILALTGIISSWLPCNNKTGVSLLSLVPSDLIFSLNLIKPAIGTIPPIA